MTRSPRLPLVFVTATLLTAAALASGATRQGAPLPTPSPTPTTAPPIAPPLLTVPTENGAAQPIRIQEATVAVTTHGVLAKTVVTLTFRNDNNRVLEGDLDFPLPDGAALTGYAVDLNNEMVDAVPVPQHEARVILEREMRKGIDPGLVEQTTGNNFRTRLYPLPAHGTRTVRIEYATQTATPGSDGTMHLLIPLAWHQTVPLLHLSVDSDAPATATLGGKTRDLLAQGTEHVKTLEDVRVDGDLTISINASKSAALLSGVMVEPFTKANGITETYFAVTRSPAVPAPTNPIVRPGRHIGLVWDASLSRRGADTRRELRLIACLAKTKWQNASVDVIVLHDRAEPVRTFAVQSGDASELIAFLQAQPFDGGTDLAGLTLGKTANTGDPYAYWLLFTDGLDTLGTNGQPHLNSAAPVFVVGSDSRSNNALLHYTAEQTGGSYMNLTSDARADDAIAATIGEAPYCLLDATVEEGEVQGISVGKTPVKQNGIVLAGRLVSDTARITLHYGYPVGDPHAQTRTITLRKADAPAQSPGLVGAIWAQHQADVLAVAPETNRDALAALGRDYHIVTPGSSLLVLETLAQHLQYGIAPARTRKALYAQYVQAAEAGLLAKRAEAKSNLDFAVSRWQTRQQWWKTEYKPTAKLPVEAARSEGEREEHGAAGTANAVGAMAGGTAAVHRAVAHEAISAPRATRRASIVVYASGSGGADIVSSRLSGQEVQKSTSDSIVVLPSPPSTRIPAIGVAIKEWTPNAPYLKALAAAPTTAAMYAAYLREREQWANAPAFYFDCAEALHRRGANDLAVRVLTGIADLQLDDFALLRIVAHRLQDWGYRDTALPLYEKVALLRPEEPQSKRDIALLLSERGDTEAQTNPMQALSDYNRALKLLNQVAIRKWDRFEGITDIAVNEANHILVRAKRLSPSAGILVNPLDPRLVQDMACDLRVVMTWDTDNTDMDLHVIEPSGEECYYSHNRTVIGGRLSDDFTQGYGPEEYLVKRGMPGKYAVRSNYFGSREQTLSGGTTVQATVYTNWCRPNETHQSMSLRLTENKETVTIGDIMVNR